VGGGEEQTDLYTGGANAFSVVKVVDDLYYNVNLMAVGVGTRAPKPVAPLPAAWQSQAGSNALVDSGTNALVLAPDVWKSILSELEAVAPALAKILQKAVHTGQPVPSSSLNLQAWPALTFVLQGETGAGVSLTVSPATYWQAGSPSPGEALCAISAMASGPNVPNQSILGLPLMNNYYTIFDRSADVMGVIRFAPIAPPQ